MDLLNLAAALVTIAALFAWFNYRFLKLPTTIGVMLLGLVASIGLLVAKALGLQFAENLAGTVTNIDFNEVLMQGMLSFLLFAGALHVKLDDLRQHKWTIGVLASFGVLASTFVIGGMTYCCWICSAFRCPLSTACCSAR